MKLSIDTTSAEKIVLKLDDAFHETEAKKRSSQRLLPFLQEVLEKEEKALSDIHSIEVVQGEGSFTGIRVGLSVAYALGWLLQIPVNGKRPDKGEFAKIRYS
jgi:tRNA threonylcarbamoyladenosine biosynthesis protein TsaB